MSEKSAMLTEEKIRKALACETPEELMALAITIRKKD